MNNSVWFLKYSHLATLDVPRFLLQQLRLCCSDDEPADYHLSELLALLTSVKSARITDGGIYDGRMGKSR